MTLEKFAERGFAAQQAADEAARTKASQSKTDQLRAAAAHLNKTERGARALRNVRAFIRDGGISLDSTNKGCVMKLILATLHNPWDLPAELASEDSQ